MNKRKEYKKQSPIERLKKHAVIDEETGCWNWDGRIDKDGYGRITITTKEKQFTMSVHRQSYAIYNNVVLTSFDIICHQCHNRKCFNPAHLKKSTRLNNSIEHLRDWNEFQNENKLLVEEYQIIKEKVKQEYLNWRRDV